MGIVNLLGGRVATIGSQFHYILADGSRGNGIPQLLPQLVLPWDMPGSEFTLSWSSLRALLPAAFSMAMLGAIESLLCAVVLDGMTGTKHKANSELVGRGTGNIIAPFFGGITATAAIARSAANVRAGATSPISAVIHAPAGDPRAANPRPAALVAAAVGHGCPAADGSVEHERGA